MPQAPQLILDLVAPEPPRFNNFLPTGNEELVARLHGVSQAENTEPSVLLWGMAGVGKTHLLHAVANEARNTGRGLVLFDAPEFPTAWPLTEVDAMATTALLVALDNIQDLSTLQQAALFTLLNEMRSHGGTLLAASALPLATLQIREDVRTRLGWGLVYQVRPLLDENKPQALSLYAKGRGLKLSEEVISYLLHHARRDLPSMLQLLLALDRYSLAAKRPITIPMAREFLQIS